MTEETKGPYRFTVRPTLATDMRPDPTSYSTLEQVECPRCGSPRKQRLSADLCQCADCGMNYHLDWVGAGLRVRQPLAPLPSPSARWTWLPLKVLLLVVLAILLLAGVSFLLAPTGSN